MLFARYFDGELLEEIRANTNKELAFGNDRFKNEIETLTGRRVQAKKRGRPLGWRKENVSFYSAPLNIIAAGFMTTSPSAFASFYALPSVKGTMRKT
jgi:hypothetical protein